MNEERKKRGLAYSKFLTAVAISALLLGSDNVMATQTVSGNVPDIKELLTNYRCYRCSLGCF